MMNEGTFMALRAEMAEANSLAKQLLAEQKRMNELLDRQSTMSAKPYQWGMQEVNTDEFITGTEFPAGAVGAVTVETVQTVDAPPSPVEVMDEAHHSDWTVTVSDTAKPAKKATPKPEKPNPHTPGG